MKCLYFDCFAGISGDMTLGALVDLGVPLRRITQELEKLPLRGYRLSARRVEKMGVAARKISVHLTARERHHRTFRDIDALIARSGLSDSVKRHSREIFLAIARAEAAVHRTRVANVHFHEVGALDSILDIVGIAIGIEHLGVETFYASPLPIGRGFIACRHGTLPLPAPATVRLLKRIPVHDAGIEGELVTPTGAAVIAHYVRCFDGLPPMTVTASGYGAGDREFADRPNLLRLILGELPNGAASEQVWVLETAIDDMNPEYAGHVMERLFAAGALDVTITPVYMKKNRPGMLLSVVCRDAERLHLAETVYRETTTAGIRFCRMQRSVLPRRLTTVATRFGRIAVKVLVTPDGERIAPEFESCRSAALRHNVAAQDVYAAVIAAGSRGKRTA